MLAETFCGLLASDGLLLADLADTRIMLYYPGKAARNTFKSVLLGLVEGLGDMVTIRIGRLILLAASFLGGFESISGRWLVSTH